MTVTSILWRYVKAPICEKSKKKALKLLHVEVCPDHSFFFQTHAQPCTVQPTKGQQIMKSFISNWWLSGQANSPDVNEHGREVLTRLVQTLNSSSTKPFTVPRCLTLCIMSQIWLPIRVQLGFGKFSFLIIKWTPRIVLKRSAVSLRRIIGNNITVARALWCKCVHNYSVQVLLAFKPFHLTHSAVRIDWISQGIRFTEWIFVPRWIFF